jgi:endonuclease III
VSKKSEVVQKLLKKITPRQPLPKPVKDANLLEHGILCVLMRHMPQERAEVALTTLKKVYPDWNELRVAQSQEIAAQMLSKGRKASRDSIQGSLPQARAVREYLQEVFQKTHSLDLEFLREDLAGSGKLVMQMPFLGLPAASYLLWLAGDKQLPVHGALVRVLDRLGLIARTASMKKARDVIDPLVPDGEALEFVATFGEIADRWCDARKPLCHECVLVEECAYGKKAFQEWKVLQVRLEAQRVKDDARRAALQKKEEARLAREAAREAKKVAAENAKRDREKKRQEAAAEKQRAKDSAAQKRLLAQQKKEAARDAALEKAAKAAKAAKAKKDVKSKPRPKVRSSGHKASRPKSARRGR